MDGCAVLFRQLRGNPRRTCDERRTVAPGTPFGSLLFQLCAFLRTGKLFNGVYKRYCAFVGIQ